MNLKSTQSLDYRSLDYREISAYKALFLDYVYRFGHLAPFFAGDPRQARVWREVAGERTKERGYRETVADILLRLNRGLDADEPALRSVDALAGGALAVVTGQQVGLFGGPLYTLYKALTTVELARRASSLLQRTVVPLFWMDTDDHDFEEVRSVRVLDSAYELVTLSYDPTDIESRVPVAWLRLDPAVDPMIEALSSSLAATEFKSEVLDYLRDCYTPGRSLSEAFGRFLLRMTHGTGLAMVDPSEPNLKSLAAPLFEREIVEKSASGRIVQETTRELVSLGYHAQVTTTADRLNLFYAAPGRFHIISQDSGFRVAVDGRLLSTEELKRLVHREPERFSPNVLLRSLYQDWILPTLAYVAGPNELAYFAQLGGVYRHFEIPMPLVVPRASFTIVEKPHLRFIERYGVELSELRSNDESLLNRILKELSPPELENDLSRAKHCVEELTQTLERDLAAVDPTLVGTVRSTRGKLLHHLGRLEAKSLRAIKRKDQTLRRQFLSARTALFPAFDMQERQLSPVQYLAKYGWRFPEMVQANIDIDHPGHVLLYL